MTRRTTAETPAVRRRLGLTIPCDGTPLGDLETFVRAAEAGGYDDLWSEEATGWDGVTTLAFAAAHTTTMRLATGVINPYTRGPALLAQTAGALSELSGGRFVLGLGSSSRTLVEGFNRGRMEPPIRKMRATLDDLDVAFGGGRMDGGFRFATPPSAPVPVMLAALRGKMLALAAERTAGAFTNFLPMSAAATVAEAFGRPDKELGTRAFRFFGPEDAALHAASRLFCAYGSQPFYRDFFAWLGWGDAVLPMAEAWDAGDRRRALELVPEDLVREIFLIGSDEAQRERITALQDAGITTVVLAFYGPREGLRSAIDALGPR